MMTRKDFEIIAVHLKSVKPEKVRHTPSEITIKQWERDVQTVAHALALVNPRFDQMRFIEACGGVTLHQK